MNKRILDQLPAFLNQSPAVLKTEEHRFELTFAEKCRTVPLTIAQPSGMSATRALKGMVATLLVVAMILAIRYCLASSTHIFTYTLHICAASSKR